MDQTQDHLTQLGKSSIEAALGVASITLRSTERLLDLNVRTAKEALDESMRSAKALSDAKNVEDLVTLQTSAAQPGIVKALAYSRGLYEVASQAQTELAKLVEARMAQASEELMAAFDKAAKAAPTGSEPAFAAFRSAVAMANSAYDTFTKATRQTAEAAVDSGSQIVTSSTKNAGKRTQ